MPSKPAQWAADFLFAMAHNAAQFSRKRGPNDEDHYYPRNPDVLKLKKNQCYHCGEMLAGRPVRGCRGYWIIARAET